MSAVLDLSTLAWTLTGWRPHAWRLAKSAGPGGFLPPEIGPVPARFPGSVQQNLLAAGLVPDWNDGLNSRQLEWVEHRHWLFATALPADFAPPAGDRIFLGADTFDHRGWVLVDSRVAGEFHGAHLPVHIDLTAALASPGPHRLALVFDQPPEEEGQLGYTSRARAFKPRFSYGWDWSVRFVPIGARGRLELIRGAACGVALEHLRTVVAEDLVRARVHLTIARAAHLSAEARVQVSAELRRDARVVVVGRATITADQRELALEVPSPELWWPAGEGAQPLYLLRVQAEIDGQPVAEWTREVGFKHVAWRACTGAPAGALPWVCVVNHRPVFLQGVNWTPVRLDYLQTPREETEGLVAQYRDLGCNLLRVWGGAGLETEDFYAACDRAGLLVWQEFPLSSSGVDSCPPADAAFVAAAAQIARHFVRSRQHHASLLLWCGGNELFGTADGPAGGDRTPLNASHPVLAAFAAIVATEDPGRRFLPTSPSGPRLHATRAEFGCGVHHEVHGPWGLGGFANREEWDAYWRDDDSLFRGEVGAAGASAAALIRRHAGGEPIWPPTTPLWLHRSAWWTQWDRIKAPLDLPDAAAALDRYVAQTQREQADCLAIAAAATKAKFPACGGFLVWMGHDAFPCPANTSIIDFARQPKPAAHALAAVFKAAPSRLR